MLVRTTWVSAKTRGVRHHRAISSNQPMAIYFCFKSVFIGGWADRGQWKSIQLT